MQRYWSRNFPVPRLRARRRVETPPAAQAQVDWAAFPGIVLGGERTDLVVAAHGAQSQPLGGDRVVAAQGHARLAFLPHGLLPPAGGRAATVRVDNEKTAVVQRRGRVGNDPSGLPTLRDDHALPRRCLRAARSPRPRAKSSAR